eukprot:c28180_g1_i1 orf=2-292(-)
MLRHAPRRVLNKVGRSCPCNENFQYPQYQEIEYNCIRFYGVRTINCFIVRIKQKAFNKNLMWMMKPRARLQVGMPTIDGHERPCRGHVTAHELHTWR